MRVRVELFDAFAIDGLQMQEGDVSKAHRTHALERAYVACVCACAHDREKRGERDRQTETDRDRDREKEHAIARCVCVCCVRACR